MTAPRAFVVVRLRAPAGDGRAVEEAYRSTDWFGAEAPGLLSSWLVRDVAEDGVYRLVGAWASLAAYRAWRDGPEHRGKPSALRPFQDRSGGPHYSVYEIV